VYNAKIGADPITPSGTAASQKCLTHCRMNLSCENSTLGSNPRQPAKLCPQNSYVLLERLSLVRASRGLQLRGAMDSVSEIPGHYIRCLLLGAAVRSNVAIAKQTK
jgi:hypothetical protein